MRVLSAAVDRGRGLPIMLDGGVLRGTDILKAFALGASFVFIGSAACRRSVNLSFGHGPDHSKRAG